MMVTEVGKVFKDATEDRERSHKPRNVGNLWKLEKAKKLLLSRISSKNAVLPTS